MTGGHNYGGVPANGMGKGNTVRGYSNVYSAGREPFSEKSTFDRGMYFVAGARRRLNIVAILISLFVPWLTFCSVSFLLSFKLHYKQPVITDVLTLLIFVFVPCLAAYSAIKAMKNKLLEPGYQPSWYVFIAVTALVAYVLGSVFGNSNFTRNMQPYYNLESLAEYVDIDTNAYLGQQLMDAGRIKFREGTGLRIDRSMGFRNRDEYCVAPIITKATSGVEAVSTDFWAVGKNCCSGYSADFHCAGFSDPKATGVIRSMSDADRPFYRLAVQQAEATYKMTAQHPLFFQWVHDADEATDSYKDEGYYKFALGCASHFVLQLFLVGVSALAFAKLVHA
jgi:hypothetical protein